jgi:hypothetical protein
MTLLNHSPQNNVFSQLKLTNGKNEVEDGPFRCIVDDDHVIRGFVNKLGDYFPASSVLCAKAVRNPE